MKYTKELIESTIKKSKSLADACRILGLSYHSDKTIKKKIKEFGLDISHFTRKGYREVYTKELLEKLVSESLSVTEILRKLNLRLTGGNHSHITKKINTFEIDISHFKGKGWNVGNRNILKNRTAKEILINRIGDKHRQKTRTLRKALLNIGRLYTCEVCGSPPIHNNLKLTLQIDHKDNNIVNDSPENLQFLCPNCHTQKTNNRGNHGNII